MKGRIPPTIPGRAALAVLAVLATLATLSGCSPAEAPPPRVEPDGLVRLTPEQVAVAGVRAESASLQAVAHQLDVPATVSSPDTALAAVGSLVEGRVESVAVLPGDTVAEGAPLVLLHSHELTDAQRDLAAAGAKLAFAESALGRSEQLLEAGAISLEEAELRRSERDALAAEVTRARDWIGYLSPDAQGRVVVRAPKGGVVFEVVARPGGGVMAGDLLVTLGRTDVLWVTGWVPERESLHLGPGDEVAVRLQPLPHKEVSARVVRMGAAVDPARRAVEIRAELSRVPAGVRPGAFATLLLPSSAAQPRLVLPAEAVQRLADGEVVFLEEGPGVYRPWPVTSYTLPDGRVAVDGVREGRRVVVEGAYAIRSAMETATGTEGEA